MWFHLTVELLDKNWNTANWAIFSCDSVTTTITPIIDIIIEINAIKFKTFDKMLNSANETNNISEKS